MKMQFENGEVELRFAGPTDRKMESLGGVMCIEGEWFEWSEAEQRMVPMEEAS